ncbi:amino acid transport protein [Acinetobacter sp. CFCC 10889]|uniref:amino acid transport protein n=1 Tax=Acinetobacter sp. CFCC 10889 TaxID=1775557 RepID=UPI000DD036F8|nr:amino acid transport protein [Acinetobacter sp. CFCC 10889]
MNVSILLLGVLFSSIGLGYFIYGKKQQRIIVLLSGIALMMYPYFIDNIMLLISVGLVLMTVPKWVKI